MGLSDSLSKGHLVYVNDDEGGAIYPHPTCSRRPT